MNLPMKPDLSGKVAVVTGGAGVLCAEFCRALAACGAEFISIFYGEDVPAGEAEQFSEAVGKCIPEAEISLVSGGQPVYYYLISAE